MRIKKCRIRKLDEGAVVLNIENGEIYYVNDTGYLIIKNLIEGADVNAVSKSLSRKFNLSFEQIRRDVIEFIEELRRAGVVE